MTIEVEGLPEVTSSALQKFVHAAVEAFGEDLTAVVLYGSAAEGRLRATSDVNTLLVLKTFDRSSADRLREPLREAQILIRLTAMFLLQDEIKAAFDAFAVKFSDILKRHKILYGQNPFSQSTVSRPREIFRLKQVLLNLMARMRNIYLQRSLREEQLALAIADLTGPIRSCAAALLELEGRQVFSPRKALELFAGAENSEVLNRLSEVREKRILPAGVSGTVLFQLLEITSHLFERANNLE